MLDGLVCLRDLIERKFHGDTEAPPSGFERLIEGARGFKFVLRRHIIAADEEYSRVSEHQLPERDFRPGSIGGVSCNRATLLQDFNVALDVGGESHFDYVINARWGNLPDACRQALLR